MTPRSLTGRLADWVSGLDFSALPETVVEAAKVLVLDCLACAIGGIRTEPGRLVERVFRAAGGRPESTVWPTGRRISTLHAAYVNAYLANALDFDDTFAHMGHPGATVIPAAIAEAERGRRPGRELLTALVAGYEVSLRLGLAIQPSPRRAREVWGFGTWHVFGAAVAAGKLRGLSAGAFEHAFGVAGVNAPVPASHKLGLAADDRPVSWAKNNFGWACMGGVLAAELAARGFRANRRILDGERGFWRMAGSDRFRASLLTDGLGRDFWLTRTAIKPYAACRWTHPVLDAAAAIRARHPGLDAGRIAAARVRTFTPLTADFHVEQPRDVVDAQFSLPYLVALELSGRSPRRGLSARHLHDRRVAAIAKRVVVVPDRAADRAFRRDGSMRATVEVVDPAGRTYRAEAALPGSAAAGRSPDAALVREKFQALVVPVVGARRAARLAAWVAGLDRPDRARSRCLP